MERTRACLGGPGGKGVQPDVDRGDVHGGFVAQGELDAPMVVKLLEEAWETVMAGWRP